MESKSESHRELAEQAPYLASLPLLHPFIVPVDYFDESEESILSAIKDGEAEVKAIEILKHAALPFEMPVDYFDRLPGDILNAIEREEGSKKISRPRLIRMQPARYKAWLAAASVVLIGGLTILFFVPEKTQGFEVGRRGGELWAEVTIPKAGPPRPIRLALKKDGRFEVIEGR